MIYRRKQRVKAVIALMLTELFDGLFKEKKEKKETRRQKEMARIE